MEHGSKYLYLSESEGQFDTNIISLKIDPLKNWKSNTSNENPIPCKIVFLSKPHLKSSITLSKLTMN